MAKIFFSYSHDDEDLRDQLEVHLAALKRRGVIETWHDRRITAGDDFSGEISENLQDSNVILLLVSPSFVASDYCYDIEMRTALEMHDAGTARVIPVILRYCDWKQTPFGSLRATPRDGKPVRAWPDIDEAFLDVVEDIKKSLPEPGPAKMARDVGFVGGVSGKSRPRSSNLGITKEFSDRELDQFLDGGIEYIKEYFLSSLDELKRRHVEIDWRIRGGGGDFSFTIYRNGNSESEVRIFLATDRQRGICLSKDQSRLGYAYNEMLQVSTVEGEMGFEPTMSMGFPSTRMERSSGLLSYQEAAEKFWGILLEPLQRA